MVHFCLITVGYNSVSPSTMDLIGYVIYNFQYIDEYLDKSFRKVSLLEEKQRTDFILAFKIMKKSVLYLRGGVVCSLMSHTQVKLLNPKPAGQFLSIGNGERSVNSLYLLGSSWSAYARHTGKGEKQTRLTPGCQVRELRASIHL